MLFRPLRAYRLFGLRVPMTPGVIPSKRHQLAENIGKMVGDHLLTSDEIGKALNKASFQDHLSAMIRERLGGILEKKLSPLPRLIPPSYRHYLDLGSRAVSDQISRSLKKYIATQEFEIRIKQALLRGYDSLLFYDIDSIADKRARKKIYQELDRIVVEVFSSDIMEQWLEDFLYSQMNHILREKKTARQILPGAIIDMLLGFIESKIPDILENLVQLVHDQDIQAKIIKAAKRGVDSFAEGLGPMGGMVQNFLNIETIEKAVKEYLVDNEEEIATWLSDEKVRSRIIEILQKRLTHYLDTPLVELLPADLEERSGEMCHNLSTQLTAVLRQEEVAHTISAMLEDNIEVYIEGGAGEVQRILKDIAGENGIMRLQRFTAKKLVVLLRSTEATNLLGKVVDRMLQYLLQKPIGRLSNILPRDVRENIYDSVQKASSTMLATEVPGVVSSLNIEQIVAEKVDSLDLLRLEGLLLSIMEEQFKYINLFGALLGFLIGGINVLLLVML